MIDVMKAILLWVVIIGFCVIVIGFIEGYASDTCTVIFKDSNGAYHELTGKID